MSEETNKLIEEKVEKLYNSLMEKPLRVLSIFNDFFGEDKVDMQGYISLDEFKSMLNKIPINTYIINKKLVDMSIDEWDIYNNMTIKDLPTSQITKVINNLQRAIEDIGSLWFNCIFILVHFPHVRVTNEHNRFVDINHLWTKVNISYNGTLNGGFALNRSEYSILHISSNYLHSHVYKIPLDNFTVFQNPCTGDGPINSTITTLNVNYDEDIWNMFCLELSKYVTVESVAGRPYHYLERLGTQNMEAGTDRFALCLRPYYCSEVLTIDQFQLRDFIRHFINIKKLKFNYVNGSYSIGMSLSEYIILISNEFISWYNDLFNKGEVTNTFNRLKKEGLLRECIIDNGKIYYETDRIKINNYLDCIGKKVCMFKGMEITISITDIMKIRNENKNIILNTQTALYILNIILKVLNYRYGRETNTTEGNQLSTEIRYL